MEEAATTNTGEEVTPPAAGPDASSNIAGTEKESDNTIKETPTRKQSSKKDGSKKKRHGARNQHRHRDFAKWLQSYFPDSFRQSHCQRRPNSGENESSSPRMHILDVAGGRGELSARLSMCLLQNVVMIDPREADIVQCFEEFSMGSSTRTNSHRPLGEWSPVVREQDETTSNTQQLPPRWTKSRPLFQVYLVLSC